MKNNNTSTLNDKEKRKKGIQLLEQWIKEMEDSETLHKDDEKSGNQEMKKYNSWETLPDTLTALHISEYLHISRRRVYELFQMHVDVGGIPNYEIGTSKRVDKEDFRDWILRKKEEKKKI